MPAKSNKQSRHKKNLVRRFFSLLGPGLIAGAADDDPSGIATYSIAGAQRDSRSNYAGGVRGGNGDVHLVAV